MRMSGRLAAGAGAIVIFGVASFSTGWVERTRPDSEGRIGNTVLVVNSRDSGQGSLREAIFAAARSEERTLILIRTSRVVLDKPLPPIVNAKGVELDAGTTGCVIDGVLGGNVILDLASDGSRVRGLTVRHASGIGLMVRASGVEIERFGAEDCDEGLRLTEDVRNVSVRSSAFRDNGIGVSVEPGARSVSVSGSEFRQNDRAGVWVVRATPRPGGPSLDLTVSGNRFEADRVSVVAIHSAARIEDNVFSRVSDAAIYVQGEGTTIRRNSVAGGGTGIFLDDAVGVRVEENELQGNLVAGALLRGGTGSSVERNRLHRNAYGIATVYGTDGRPNVVLDNVILGNRIDGIAVVGGSPVVRGNRILDNDRAGVRILDLIQLDGGRVVAAPRLAGNQVRGNLQDEPVRGEYHVERPKESE